MAIQRQAENPGESLVIGEPFRYSIKPTKKKTSVPVTPAVPVHTVESVRKDLLYTAAVFAGIFVVLLALYFKMR